MTAAEFSRWTEHTACSKDKWQLDEVHYLNAHEYLLYMGGERGKFISIDKDGKFSMGTYEGAIPHIGDASFKTTFSMQCKSREDALNRCIQAGDINFVYAVLHCIDRYL